MSGVRTGKIFYDQGTGMVTPNEMQQHLSGIRFRVEDKRWEIGFCVDDHSQWYRAYHPNGVIVDRAQADSLIQYVNSIKVMS